MPTLSCPEAPPCTLVLLIVCRRKSPPLPPQPSRSRSSLPPRGSTPYGSVDPSLPPSPPSNRCGSPRRNTTNPALESSTASASKYSLHQSFLLLGAVLSSAFIHLLATVIHTYYYFHSLVTFYRNYDLSSILFV